MQSEVSKKIYGALILMSDTENIVEARLIDIAINAGYNSTGGMHTMALNWLDENNYITKLAKRKWKVHLR